MLVGYLAGRAAEEIVFNSVTTGAANDIEQATKLARAMVTQYGMSEKFGLMGLATQQDQYLTGRMVMNCGDATAAEVDNEVMRILKESYEEAKRLLRDNRDVMDKIAEFLIEKETITGKEFMEIFRKCKGIPEPEKEDGEENEAERNKAEKAEIAGIQTTEDEAVEKESAKKELADNRNEETEETEETEKDRREEKAEMTDTQGWVSSDKKS